MLADEQSSKEEIICNNCSIELKKTRVYLNAGDKNGLSKGEDGQEKETNSETGSTSSKVKSEKDDPSTKQTKMLTRKSTRSKRGSNRLNLKSNQSSKGKSRRNIFKRNVSLKREIATGCRPDSPTFQLTIEHFFSFQINPPSQGLQIAILHLLSDDQGVGLPQRYQLHRRRHRLDGRRRRGYNLLRTDQRIFTGWQTKKFGHLMQLHRNRTAQLIRSYHLGPILREERCHHLADTEQPESVQADQPVQPVRLRARPGRGLPAKTGLHGVRLPIAIRLLQSKRESILNRQVSSWSRSESELQIHFARNSYAFRWLPFCNDRKHPSANFVLLRMNSNENLLLGQAIGEGRVRLHLDDHRAGAVRKR